MKFKLIIILSIFLTIISLNSISAVDNSTIEFNGNNFNDLDNIIKNSENEDTIKFKNNLTVNNAEKEEYKEGILIDKDNLIIDGDGYSINGDNSVKIFKITGNNVIVKNLVFINTYGSFGGSIHNTGDNTTLINNTFNNNTLVSGTGGVIYNTGDNFKIVENNIFSNNSALSGSGVVIYNTGNDFLIDGENLFENNYGELGVGIVIFNVGGYNFKIQGNNIFQNNEGFSGIVLYNSAENFQIVGKNVFRYNTASYYGGALYNNFTTNFTITGENVFEENIATDGGAIYNTKGPNFTISGKNIIYNNFARNSGSGIFNLNGLNFSISGENIIKDNIAENIAGGIFNSNADNFEMIGNNIIENNIAIFGGGLYVSGKNFYIEGNEFKNNSAENGSSIFISKNSSLKIKDSLINGEEYLIYNNNGYLFLENNSLKAEKTTTIYNNGTITSLIYLIFNNNQTISTENNTVKLTSKIVDDNKNIIVGGNVTFNINNQKISTDNIENGQYILNQKFIDYGEYVIEGTYNQANNISILSGKVIKYKFKSFINMTVSNYESGENILFNISLLGENKELLNGSVILYLNNESCIINVNNGQGNHTVDYLDGGNYTATSIFEGKEIYAASNDTFNFNIYKKDVKLITEDISIYYSNGAFEAILKDLNDNPLSNYTIYFIINNQTYAKTTNNKGIASIAINLNHGNYSILTMFNNSTNFNKKYVTNNIEIKSTLEANNIIKFYKNDTQYEVLLLDKDGNILKNNEVKMNINGVLYTRKTNDKGIAILSINLNPGSYIVTVENPITNEKISNNITVLKTLESSDIIKYYKNDTKYSVKVLDNTGKAIANKNITMNINGVLYTRKTNDDGIAVLSINLNPGNYTITVTNPIDGLKISNNIKVLATLIGEDLEKTFDEAKSYNVKVLNNIGENNPNQNVTININGVFYNRITDNEGIAKLNINLNHGSYIATAQWNGYLTSNNIIVK